jgi:polar amino acid transport system substrate-binding protein
MLKRSSVLSSLVLAAVLVACGGEPETAPTGSPAPTPTATRPPAVRGDPNETPVPSPVTRSALDDIRQRGELRVGILYNYPPFAFLADDGRVQGYEAELIRHIAERWGVGVTFTQVTRQTRFPLLYAGEVDMLAGAMPHRRELEQFVEFSETIFRSGYVVLAPSDAAYANIAAIGGGTVGLVAPEAQTAYSDYAAGLGVTPSIRTFDTLEKATAALVQGEVSALVGRRETMMRVASTTDGMDIIDEFVQVEPYAFAVRRGDVPLRDLINLTLYGIAKDDLYSELFSANFYAFAPDLFPVLSGEAAYTFETFPTQIPVAEPVIERIRRGEPLRVAGMNLTTAPPLFDGQPIIDGYNRAVVNELARRWNVPVTEIPDSAGDIGLGMLEAGQADLVVGVRPDLSAVGRLAFSQPYYQRGLRLIHMIDVTVFGIGDLEFKPSMAVEPLDISQDLIEDNNGWPEVQTSDSLEDAYQALLSRAVYAVVGDEYAMMLMAQSDMRIQVIEDLYRPTDHVIALSPHTPDFLALLNFTLQDMKADGTLDRLRKQYFGAYAPTGETMEEFTVELWPSDGSYLGVGGYTE